MKKIYFIISIVALCSGCVKTTKAEFLYDREVFEPVVQWRDCRNSFMEAINIADIAVKIDSVFSDPDAAEQMFPGQTIQYSYNRSTIYLQNDNSYDYKYNVKYKISRLGDKGLNEAGAAYTIQKQSMWSSSESCSFTVTNAGNSCLEISFNDAPVQCNTEQNNYNPYYNINASFNFIISWVKIAKPKGCDIFEYCMLSGSGHHRETNIDNAKDYYDLSFLIKEPMRAYRNPEFGYTNEVLMNYVNIVIFKGMVDMETSHSDRGTLCHGQVRLSTKGNEIIYNYAKL